MYVLGIDGGGTKTKGVIADKTGKVIAQHTVGASNPNSIDPSVIEQEIKMLLHTLKEQADTEFQHLSAAFAGMSGVDREEDQIKMKRILGRLLPPDTRLIIDNDGLSALYSGTLGKSGIVNIAGTGSITFGINSDGQRARVGGWGYLIGDPGSGYEIGKYALQAIFQAYDGCGEKTRLTELILERIGVQSPPNLIEKIYELGMARKSIAPLSQLVVKAADEGDEVAQRVLLKAGGEMADAINCLLRKLFSKANEQEAIYIVLAGGVYRRSDWFVPTIKTAILKSGYNTEIVVPEVPPVVGALVAAWKAVDVQVGQGFNEQLLIHGISNE
jgi:N-acetylglucosamine kinase-like BadF-type ATPase